MEQVMEYEEDEDVDEDVEEVKVEEAWEELRRRMWKRKRMGRMQWRRRRLWWKTGDLFGFLRTLPARERSCGGGNEGSQALLFLFFIFNLLTPDE
ncbi:unnamed protein product [Nippostrongylus brasiliensis]|uniref:Uncharacterized protein n=1 Tax=Nippostrongylus brasiliensis TaxID=27835 RepID=A0A0N4YGA5_NIPBR|nr:unnamed protein product [Nippostrongylus brasiliensis]